MEHLRRQAEEFEAALKDGEVSMGVSARRRASRCRQDQTPALVRQLRLGQHQEDGPHGCA